MMYPRNSYKTYISQQGRHIRVMYSQITDNLLLFNSFFGGNNKKQHKNYPSLALHEVKCHRWFPSQSVSNPESVPLHDATMFLFRIAYNWSRNNWSYHVTEWLEWNHIRGQHKASALVMMIGISCRPFIQMQWSILVVLIVGNAFHIAGPLWGGAIDVFHSQRSKYACLCVL